MEAKCSSETSDDTQRSTRLYIPEDGTFHNHRCGNLKSYKVILTAIFERVDQVSLGGHLIENHSVHALDVTFQSSATFAISQYEFSPTALLPD
jgi:hypothetical protein